MVSASRVWSWSATIVVLSVLVTLSVMGGQAQSVSMPLEVAPPDLEIPGSVYVAIGGEARFLPGITVFVRDLASGRESPRVKSDCRGRFVTPKMPPASYEVCWQAPGYVNACGARVVALDGVAVLPRPFELEPRLGTIAGSVEWIGGAGGLPVVAPEGVGRAFEVALLEVRGTAPLGTAPVSCTGQFTFAGVAEGMYSVQASLAGEAVSAIARTDGGTVSLVFAENAGDTVAGPAVLPFLPGAKPARVWPRPEQHEPPMAGTATEIHTAWGG